MFSCRPFYPACIFVCVEYARTDIHPDYVPLSFSIKKTKHGDCEGVREGSEGDSTLRRPMDPLLDLREDDEGGRRRFHSVTI